MKKFGLRFTGCRKCCFKRLLLVRGFLWSSITLQVFFLIYTFLAVKWGPFIFSWNLLDNTFCFFLFCCFFSKLKKCYNLPFDNIFKMYYLLNMPFRFFRSCFYYIYFNEAFLKNLWRKIILTQIFKIHFKIFFLFLFII